VIQGPGAAVAGVNKLALAIIGAVICAMVYAADARIGGVLIFIVIFSLLSYAVAKGSLT
jgi:hypothetical protein